MQLVFSYLRMYFLITLRNPPAFFFTLVFPPLMLLLTAHQWGTSRFDRLHAFVIFLNYSVQTVSLMLLGMGVTQEKNSEWSKYLRTLPAPISYMVLGRILHTLFLCCLNVIVIIFMGVFVLSIPVTLFELSYLFMVALLGAIPMALIGMTIGYAANPESSRSIFTLLNLLLLFGSFSLPASGAFLIIRQFIPTYQWTQISLKVISPEISLLSPLICLACYVIVFSIMFQKVYLKRRKK